MGDMQQLPVTLRSEAAGYDSDFGSDSATTDTPATHKPTRTYRPKSDGEKLEKLLFDWRLKIRAEDPTTMLFPLDDILPADSISQLASFKPEDLEISSAASVTDFLEESEEWNSIYAPEVYEIISKSNSMATSEEMEVI